MMKINSRLDVMPHPPKQVAHGRWYREIGYDGGRKTCVYGELDNDEMSDDHALAWKWEDSVLMQPDRQVHLVGVLLYILIWAREYLSGDEVEMTHTWQLHKLSQSMVSSQQKTRRVGRNAHIFRTLRSWMSRCHSEAQYRLTSWYQWRYALEIVEPSVLPDVKADG